MKKTNAQVLLFSSKVSVVSDSVRPHRWQPIRLPHPWDSPGKNTGVGCHFLLQCMRVKSESEVAQSCPTPSKPMDCSPPGSSIHGICQAGVLEWGAIAYCHYITTICLLPLYHDWSTENNRILHHQNNHLIEKPVIIL